MVVVFLCRNGIGTIISKISVLKHSVCTITLQYSVFQRTRNSDLFVEEDIGAKYKQQLYHCWSDFHWDTHYLSPFFLAHSWLISVSTSGDHPLYLAVWFSVSFLCSNTSLWFTPSSGSLGDRQVMKLLSLHGFWDPIWSSLICSRGWCFQAGDTIWVLCATPIAGASPTFPSPTFYSVYLKNKTKQKTLDSPGSCLKSPFCDRHVLLCKPLSPFFLPSQKHWMRRIKQGWVKSRRRWSRRYNEESVRLLSKGRWGTLERLHRGFSCNLLCLFFLFLRLCHPACNSIPSLPRILGGLIKRIGLIQE